MIIVYSKAEWLEIYPQLNATSSLKKKEKKMHGLYMIKMV